LSDGATFSSSAPVSSDGLWPFYLYSAAGKDTVLGWVTVSNGLSSTNNGLTSTNITWSKPAGKVPLYPAGFTNTLQMIGSTWVTPSKNSVVLSLTNPAVVLTGGDLPMPLSLPANFKNSLLFASTNVNLSIRPSTGIFSGWFDNPNTKERVTISGVVLTNADSARGFFLGTDESGSVLLQGQ